MKYKSERKEKGKETKRKEKKKKEKKKKTKRKKKKKRYYKMLERRIRKEEEEKKFNPTKSLVSWIALNTIFLSCVSVTFSLFAKVNGFNEQIPRLDLTQ